MFPMLTVSDAFAKIISLAPSVRSEIINLSDACGRILHEPVFADRDYPPINRATMDGIAINEKSWSAGVRSWEIESTLAAGIPASRIRDIQHGCAQIMTGAEVPDNAHGIIPFEDVIVDGQTSAAKPSAKFQPGIHIHVRGIDRTRGDLLLSGGIRLDAPRIAILAAVGHARVNVTIPPIVAIVSTGNEIVPIHQEQITPTQVRASNLTALKAALQQLGVTNIACGHLPDDLAKTAEEIGQLLTSCDLLILSGGVSMGKYDFVPEALRSCGVQEVFHKVAQKPGKPLWFGRTPSCFVFGLPGNPVSTLTVFRRYVAPFILTSMGVPSKHQSFARTVASIVPHQALTTFPPVSLIANQQGIIQVEPVTYHGSGDFAALADSDGFIEVPPGTNRTPPDTSLPYFSWSSI